MSALSLDSPVQFVKGIGPRRAEALDAVGVRTVQDLLFYFPRGYIDRSNTVPIGQAVKDSHVTVVGRVLGKGSMYGGRKGGKRFEMILGDDSGHISLLWFAGWKYIDAQFEKGDLLAATGAVGFYNGSQIIHPEIEALEDESAELVHTGRIVPLYPSSETLTSVGLSSRGFRRAIKFALDNCAQEIYDHAPAALLSQYDLPALNETVRQIHFPDDDANRERARRRLAFEEFAELQYLVLRFRKDAKIIRKERLLAHHGELVKSFAAALPYKFTPGQREAIREIYADMAGDKPMNRLLQGDVGCGKTAVAIASAVYAVENRKQVTFMAPTELLAEQHFRNWKPILSAIDISGALVTGSLKTKERSLLSSRIASGKTRIIFGTHALLSQDIVFRDLGLIIIDEQHRFGVAQRGRLIEKGRTPDILAMSATPIPRTLALTLYGDLDFTTIPDLPPGRQPVKTVWRPAGERSKIYQFIGERVAKREQVFVIYPLVQRSENSDMLAAEEAYKTFKEELFPRHKVALAHGQLKAAEQDARIQAFARGETDILIATTVVEVGVDIPGACVMVVEHAERFGLAQLHQLRGRVGRGGKAGFFVAVACPPISDIVRKRLNYLVAHHDGFDIAEADLKLRGAGEIFGLRQSGLPTFRMANLSGDRDLLVVARDWMNSALADQDGATFQAIVAHYSARAGEREKYGAVA